MIGWIRNIFIVTLAFAGIRLDKFTNSRIDALLLIFLGYASHLLLVKYNTLQLSLVYFFILFIIRYAYLFGGFIKNGFSGWLINKYGEEKAWNIYEALTSVMFFQRGLSFGLLTEATKWSLLNIAEPYLLQMGITDILLFKYVCIAVGLILVIIGFWVNISATLVIGLDTYYYKDLFLKRSIIDFKVEGPYKYFANPMYGIGQCSGYGSALMLGSVEGIAATLLNQVMMYIFYFVIEKPHINNIVNKLKINPIQKITISPVPLVRGSKETVTL